MAHGGGKWRKLKIPVDHLITLDERFLIDDLFPLKMPVLKSGLYAFNCSVGAAMQNQTTDQTARLFSSQNLRFFHTVGKHLVVSLSAWKNDIAAHHFCDADTFRFVSFDWTLEHDRHNARKAIDSVCFVSCLFFRRYRLARKTHRNSSDISSMISHRQFVQRKSHGHENIPSFRE